MIHPPDKEIVPPPEGDYDTSNERDSGDEQETDGTHDSEQPQEEGRMVANVDGDLSDDDIGELDASNGHQNYCSVKRRCDELCHAIANDQPQLQSIFATTVTEMIGIGIPPWGGGVICGRSSGIGASEF
jgi:hypothetical protein